MLAALPNDNYDNSSLCQLRLILFSLSIDGMAQKKTTQNLLTWCLSSVEGNDEAILSWSFYGLANNQINKIGGPVDNTVLQDDSIPSSDEAILM
ncbi:unnamed protein product [Prunus armeniaca]